MNEGCPGERCNLGRDESYHTYAGYVVRNMRVILVLVQLNFVSWRGSGMLLIKTVQYFSFDLLTYKPYFVPLYVVLTFENACSG